MRAGSSRVPEKTSSSFEPFSRQKRLEPQVPQNWRTARSDERYVAGSPDVSEKRSRGYVTNPGTGEPVWRWHCLQKQRFELEGSP